MSWLLEMEPVTIESVNKHLIMEKINRCCDGVSARCFIINHRDVDISQNFEIKK